MKTLRMILGALILILSTAPSTASLIPANSNEEVIGCYAMGADVPDVAAGDNFLGVQITKTSDNRYNVYVQEFVVISGSALASGRFVHKATDVKKFASNSDFILYDDDLILTINSTEQTITGMADGKALYSIPLVSSDEYCGPK